MKALVPNRFHGGGVGKQDGRLEVPESNFLVFFANRIGSGFLAQHEMFLNYLGIFGRAYEVAKVIAFYDSRPQRFYGLKRVAL